MAVNDQVNTPEPDRPMPAVPPDPVAAALDRVALELARDTDRAPSPQLLPAVMRTVWAELRSGQRIPLPDSADTLFVTEAAAGNALVAHIEGLAGMIVRGCAVSYEPPTHGGSLSSSIRITLTTAVAYGTDTDALLTLARSVIEQTAVSLFGLTVSSVDVGIVDVYPTGRARSLTIPTAPNAPGQPAQPDPERETEVTTSNPTLPVREPAAPPDAALIARIAAHQALRVPGVVRLQPGLRNSFGRAARAMFLPGAPADDQSAADGVEVSTAPDPQLTLRIVTTASPTPRVTAAAVQKHVANSIQQATGHSFTVLVVVVDVDADT